MANIIAVVWDFDKTLISGYMEDPIFEEYGVNAHDFWKETNDLPQRYNEEQKVKVNPDTIYLNQFINYTKRGTFRGLNNAKLRAYGEKLNYYPGVPEIFQKTKEMIEKDSKYNFCDIKVEHFIVSTGLTEIIRGSKVMKYVTDVWGCEFIETQGEDGDWTIGEIGYSIDNTTKTRALFEINKGVGHSKGITVNTRLPKQLRRVQFENMIYIADGPSDIPAFSVVNQNGGATFAIYPKGNMEAMRQVEQMRMDGRINMFAEADYSEGTTAYMWICNKIEEIANRIYDEERQKIEKYAAVSGPKHLI